MFHVKHMKGSDIMNMPFNYMEQQYINHFGLQPTSVKGERNVQTFYYKRELYDKIYSCFEFGLPKHWAMNWFRFWLFHCGSIGVVYTHKYGWVDQPYSVERLDYQWNPYQILVYNTYIPETRGIIGVNSTIIKLFDDFRSMESLVNRYAEMLANCDKATNVSLMNANIAYLFRASSKKNSQEIKEAYQEATTGNPLVIIDKEALNGESFEPMFPNVKNNFVAPDTMETRRAIMNAFLTEIGIRNVSVQKKERLTSGETDENNDETKSVVSVIYDNLKSCFDDTNKISGLNLTVKLRYDYSMRNNVSRETSTSTKRSV